MINLGNGKYRTLESIEQNEKLRKEIVYLADIWDGKVSDYYGDVLYKILEELGIPVFYNMNRGGMSKNNCLNGSCSFDLEW